MRGDSEGRDVITQVRGSREQGDTEHCTRTGRAGRLAGRQAGRREASRPAGLRSPHDRSLGGSGLGAQFRIYDSARS